MNDTKYSIMFWGRDEDALYENLGYHFDVTKYLEGGPYTVLLSNEKEYYSLLNHIDSMKDKNDWCVVVSKNESVIAHHETIARMVLVYKGVEYPYEENFGVGYDPDSAEFMFFEGNFSCDCNLYDFIYKRYPESFGEYVEKECGEEIKIKDFEIVLRKYGGSHEQ